jgi:GTP-binding protein HflX
VIINDTVGFIRDLPPDLIAAFRSTLEEIDGSRLLIHLVDAANPRWQQQIASVDRILVELNVNRIPRLLVLNKTDLIDEMTREAMLRQLSLESGIDAIAISASHRESLRPLLNQIEQLLVIHQERNQQPEPQMGAASPNQ